MRKKKDERIERGKGEGGRIGEEEKRREWKMVYSIFFLSFPI